MADDPRSAVPSATAEKVTFGVRLKKLRNKAGLSRTQLAARIDTHAEVVARWERDENKPLPYRVVQLCRVLHCSRKELCG